jgi:hypothetical protein
MFASKPYESVDQKVGAGAPIIGEPSILAQ